MDDYIELNAFIKLKMNIPTGGQAKILIRSGVVLVNGAIETQNKKKLVKGDKVAVNDQEWIV